MKNLAEDTGRAKGIRRHHRNPERVREIRAKVRACMLADDSAKATAANCGLSPTDACRWACVLGFRRMYVTAEERAHLMARRAEAKT